MGINLHRPRTTDHRPQTTHFKSFLLPDYPEFKPMYNANKAFGITDCRKKGDLRGRHSFCLSYPAIVESSRNRAT